MDSHSTTLRETALFGEKFRPAFHFTPASNWINDPNGLLFHNGLYHLFYQHNPSGNLWGNMSWGHSVSANLYDWKHLPVAISYDETFGIFSGSAVVDYTNTSGFGTSEKPAMVAIYTAHRHDETEQSQHIAFSLDEGLTWTKYEGNPVLSLSMKDFRDPKVSWDASTSTWLMAVAKPQEFKIAFFRSQDLKSWHHLSDFGPVGATGGCWECPDLFPLTTENGEIKWVLLVSLNPGGIAGGSGTQYFIGDWNGTIFIPDHNDGLWIDYGRDNYAGVTFNNTGDERIFIGWMSNWDYAREIPTEIWRGSMTMPRRLSLQSINSRLHLLSTPIPTEKARCEKFTIDTSHDFEVRFVNNAGEIKVGYDSAQAQLYIDRSGAWFTDVDTQRQVSPVISANSFSLEIYIDHGSLELFAPDLAIAMTSQHLLYNEGLESSTLNSAKPHA